MLANSSGMRTDFRLCEDQCGIKVGNLVARTFYSSERFFEEHCRIGALPLRIGRREQRANVRRSHGSQERVRDRVQQNVAIRMPAKALGIVERDPANLQRNSGLELVRVPSVANADARVSWF